MTTENLSGNGSGNGGDSAGGDDISSMVKLANSSPLKIMRGKHFTTPLPPSALLYS